MPPGCKSLEQKDPQSLIVLDPFLTLETLAFPGFTPQLQFSPGSNYTNSPTPSPFAASYCFWFLGPRYLFLVSIDLSYSLNSSYFNWNILIWIIWVMFVLIWRYLYFTGHIIYLTYMLHFISVITDFDGSFGLVWPVGAHSSRFLNPLAHLSSSWVLLSLLHNHYFGYIICFSLLKARIGHFPKDPYSIQWKITI